MGKQEKIRERKSAREVENSDSMRLKLQVFVISSISNEDLIASQIGNRIMVETS